LQSLPFFVSCRVYSREAQIFFLFYQRKEYTFKIHVVIYIFTDNNFEIFHNDETSGAFIMACEICSQYPFFLILKKLN